MSSPGLLESMETMAKLWLADTASSPLLLLLLSFAFSLGSGNAEGSSNGLGDFPLLFFFFCLCVSWVSQSSALSPVRSPCFVTFLSVFVSGSRPLFPLVLVPALPPVFSCFSPLCYPPSPRSLFPLFSLSPAGFSPVYLPFFCVLCPAVFLWFSVPCSLGFSSGFFSSSPVIPLFSGFFYGFCSSSLLWFSVPQNPRLVLFFSSPPFCLCSALPFIEPEHAENPFPCSSIHEQDHGQEIVVSWP